MDGAWDQKRQEQLREYIASLARVTSSAIWLSEPLTTSKPPTKNDRRSLSNLQTVTIRVRIEVDRLPFRPLRCRDPGACNFNEVTTARFNASDSSSTDFCSYACKSKTATTVDPVPAMYRDTNVKVVDDDDDTADMPSYLFYGIGIGVAGTVVVVVIGIVVAYGVLRSMHYRPLILKDVDCETEPSNDDSDSDLEI